MPKISAIVPVYNVEEYLSRCLDSLIEQTLQDIEIICVNDGSTDNCAQILEEYSNKDERIKVVTQKNMGISIARNEGVKISTGEYISFIDSDDWVDKDFYEKLYNAALETNADVAAAGIYRISKKYKYKILKFKKSTYTQDFTEKLQLCDIPDSCFVWNKLYKKEALLNSDLKFVPGVVYEDILYTPQVLFYTKGLVTVPDTYYYYFRHKNTIVTQNNSKAKQDRENSVKKLKAFLLERNIDVSKWETKVKKFRLFGLTLFKIITKGEEVKYVLFNSIIWEKRI